MASSWTFVCNDNIDNLLPLLMELSVNGAVIILYYGTHTTHTTHTIVRVKCWNISQFACQPQAHKSQREYSVFNWLDGGAEVLIIDSCVLPELQVPVYNIKDIKISASIFELYWINKHRRLTTRVCICMWVCVCVCVPYCLLWLPAHWKQLNRVPKVASRSQSWGAPAACWWILLPPCFSSVLQGASGGPP